MADEILDASLQKHVLAMLLFDKEEAKRIKSVIPIECWTSDPGILGLVNSTYAYIDTYDEAPGRMIYDLLSSIPKISDDQRLLLKDVIQHCEHEYPEVNKIWVNNRLNAFFRSTLWGDAIQKAANLHKAKEFDKLETLMTATMKRKLVTFEPGYKLSDVVANAIMERDNPGIIESVQFGIPAFKKRGVAMESQALTLFIAPAKRGKSWALAYCGKQGIVANKRVLHISLEMNQQKMGIRYLQALQAFYTRPPVPRQFVRLHHDPQGNYQRYAIDPHPNVPHLNQAGFLESLYESYSQYSKWQSENLRIKEFPTRKLKMGELENYLDEQEKFDGFVPNMIVLDYIDLMWQKQASDSGAVRSINDALYQDFRGVLSERNIIGVSATQGNRTGAQTETDAETVSENYGKVAQVDLAIAINQKPAEKKAGLARLTVARARNTEDSFTVVVEQNLGSGQFAIKSQDHSYDFEKQYREILKEFTGEDAKSA